MTNFLKQAFAFLFIIGLVSGPVSAFSDFDLRFPSAFDNSAIIKKGSCAAALALSAYLLNKYVCKKYAQAKDEGKDAAKLKYEKFASCTAAAEVLIKTYLGLMLSCIAGQKIAGLARFNDAKSFFTRHFDSLKNRFSSKNDDKAAGATYVNPTSQSNQPGQSPGSEA